MKTIVHIGFGGGVTTMMRDLSLDTPGIRSIAIPFGPSTITTTPANNNFVWKGLFRLDLYILNSWRLYRWFRRLRPEVVVLHGFLPMVFLSLPAKKAGVKAVLGIDVGPQPTFKLAKKILFWLSRNALTEVASVSQGSAEWFTHNYSWLKNRVKTIVIGVDMPTQKLHKQRLIKPPYVISTISRMDTPQKDPMTLVRAGILLLRRKIPIQIQLVGDGNLLPTLKKYILEQGVQNNIHCLGHRTDLDVILEKSDIFVLATNWEGLSLSMLMAMAHGLPIVASNVVGVAGVITDRETGRLYQNNNDKELAKTIEDLIKEPKEASAMGTRAATEAEKKYNRSRMRFEYQKWFSSYLAEENACVID